MNHREKNEYDQFSHKNLEESFFYTRKKLLVNFSTYFLFSCSCERTSSRISVKDAVENFEESKFPQISFSNKFQNSENYKMKNSTICCLFIMCKFSNSLLLRWLFLFVTQLSQIKCNIYYKLSCFSFTVLFQLCFCDKQPSTRNSCQQTSCPHVILGEKHPKKLINDFFLRSTSAQSVLQMERLEKHLQTNVRFVRKYQTFQKLIFFGNPDFC